MKTNDCVEFFPGYDPKPCTLNPNALHHPSLPFMFEMSFSICFSMVGVDIPI